MADLDSYSVGGPIGNSVNPKLTVRFQGFANDWWPQENILASMVTVHDTLTRGVPIVQPEYDITSYKVNSFKDDYYNRIYFIPSVLSVGVVTNPIDKEFMIWNAYLHDVTLDSIDFVDADMVQITDLPLPNTFLPVQFKTVNANVKPGSTLNIDAKLTFNFDVPYSYEFRIVGSTSKLWPFPPNWKNGYQLTYEFATEILQARSGREQRIALRSTPRRRFEFNAILTRDDYREYKRLINMWQLNAFVFQDPTRYAIVPSGVTPNAIAITLADVPNWVVEGMSVILDDGQHKEVRNIIDITNDVVTFESSSGTQFAPNTRLYGTMVSNVDGSLRSGLHSNNTATLSVSGYAKPALEAYATPPDAIELYNDKEVFSWQPNWASLPSLENQHELEDLDFGRGLIERFNKVDFPKEIREYTYLSRSFEESEEIRYFFERQHGRQGEFYLPSWEPDMVLTADIPIGSSVIRVAGTDLLDSFKFSRTHLSILVKFTDGSTTYRTITNMQYIEDDTQVTVDVAFPDEILMGDVVHISFMPTVRFASDALNVEWVTDEVCQFKISFETVEDLATEV